MKFLFTGSNGFLGRNIVPILKNDREVLTLDIAGEVDYRINLALNIPKVDKAIDVVIHAAGKAHFVPRKKSDEMEFFAVNVNGTKNLCNALQKVNHIKALIYISTAAVYGLSAGENINEDTPLKGNSAYAKSKIEAEAILADWCKKNDVILSIIRPSLIAGMNPPGNLGKMIEGIKSGRYFSIGNGSSRRSIVMVQDLAKIIIPASEKAGIYNICDDKHPSFRELEILICSQLKKRQPIAIPMFVAKSLAAIGDLAQGYLPLDSVRLDKMTNTLTFSNMKIKNELGYSPTDVLNNFRIK